MVSGKIMKKLKKKSIYKMTPAQRTGIVSVFITYKTNEQLLLQVT